MRRKIKLITQILEEKFPDPQIPLRHTDPYTLLIAVLLSAQCTDERVNRITPLLFAKANTPESMSQLDVQTIEEIIRPCGLYKTKAKAIKELSRLLHQNHQGKVPATFKELESLPGVGHKTASVVLTQAFHIPAFPVDTHIHRLAKRWGLSSGKSVTQTEIDLKKAFPKSTWNKIHLQMIYYARTFCPARGHNLALCPICAALSDKNSR